MKQVEQQISMFDHFPQPVIILNATLFEKISDNFT